jgi:hypothetical protein
MAETSVCDIDDAPPLLTHAKRLPARDTSKNMIQKA